MALGDLRLSAHTGADALSSLSVSFLEAFRARPGRLGFSLLLTAGRDDVTET